MRILVVDDAEAMRFLLSRWFESLGHEVTALASGREVAGALAAARFDADSSGWDVLQTVRAGAPGVPVVLVTGWTDGAPGPAGLVADAVLEKPISLDRLSAALASVSQRR
jgi:CheY-like chemotaxis protein